MIITFLQVIFYAIFCVITCIDTASSEQSADDDDKENRTDEVKSDRQQGCVFTNL